PPQGYRAREERYPSLFLRLPFFEHLDDAVRDQIPAHQIGGGCEDRDESEHKAQRGGILFASNQNGADHRDCRDRVRQGHQRRVQKRRDTPDQLKAQKDREHEYPQSEFVRFHELTPSDSRTRGCTIWFPWVTRVSRMISSSRFRFRAPSRTMSLRKAVTLDANIWLAWYGTIEGRLSGPRIVTPW